jgi:hypothetical protein
MEIDMEKIVDGLMECKCLFFLVNRRKYEQLSPENQASLIQLVNIIMTHYLNKNWDDEDGGMTEELREVWDTQFIGEVTDMYYDVGH